MRCRACNEVMGEHEIVWRPEIGQHEDLCLCCRRAIFTVEEDLEVGVSIVDDEDIRHE